MIEIELLTSREVGSVTKWCAQIFLFTATSTEYLPQVNPASCLVLSKADP